VIGEIDLWYRHLHISYRGDRCRYLYACEILDLIVLPHTNSTPIASNQINPWPDGTAFAKVAWERLRDESGVGRPGKFYQVEFMIRDGKKYSSTLGWGWARWRGTQLKPYGADPNFANECVSCHRPLKPTDYVFTEPILISERGRQ